MNGDTILCPDCGNCIGQLRDLFLAARKEVIEEYLGSDLPGITPEILSIAEVRELPLGKQLDDIGLRLECCRGKMISQVQLKEYK